MCWVLILAASRAVKNRVINAVICRTGCRCMRPCPAPHCIALPCHALRHLDLTSHCFLHRMKNRIITPKSWRRPSSSQPTRSQECCLLERRPSWMKEVDRSSCSLKAMTSIGGGITFPRAFFRVRWVDWTKGTEIKRAKCTCSTNLVMFTLIVTGINDSIRMQTALCHHQILEKSPLFLCVIY